ncbi:MAG: tRNA (adenosine(37)-N6)-threonylcarbamoyltransferase complex ATPase subunit type 1 TsaE [Clostridia bacterium]|nr:tRNA (adenosine(37)-N6)-threonylcarbamoyltransferase complex ATPase subunit type 1 TsaE [Clostridia bacterium]
MKYKETVVRTKNADETENFGYEFAAELNKGSVIALCGPLGAGKTTFVRGIAKRLTPECASLVHSPTFTVVNEYRGSSGCIYHFDFYRLKSEDDLYSCGFDDYFDENGIIIVEWADMFLKSLPGSTIVVNIEKEGEDGRKLTVRVPE